MLCDAQRMPIRIGSQTKFATVGRGHNLTEMLISRGCHHWKITYWDQEENGRRLQPLYSAGNGLCPDRRQVSTWTRVDKVPWRRISLVSIKLINQINLQARSAVHETQRMEPASHFRMQISINSSQAWWTTISAPAYQPKSRVTADVYKWNCTAGCPCKAHEDKSWHMICTYYDSIETVSVLGTTFFHWSYSMDDEPLSPTN